MEQRERRMTLSVRCLLSGSCVVCVFPGAECLVYEEVVYGCGDDGCIRQEERTYCA